MAAETTDEGLDATGTTPPRLTLADLRALTPDDLRDLSELRREHGAVTQECARRAREQARLEDENGYLRAQLVEAMAGWRDEQRRGREPLTPPAVEEVVEKPTPSGPWSRLWAWLAD